MCGASGRATKESYCKPLPHKPLGKSATANSHNLYNGNIGHMVTTIRPAYMYSQDNLDTPLAVAQPQGTAYKYDQLNRLNEAFAWQNLDLVDNEWESGGSHGDKYYNAFTYDASGNILTQVRHDENGAKIDDLTYRYAKNAGGKLVQNRLYHVNDVVSDGNYSDDIDDMGTFTSTLNNINTHNNFSYDGIGQLVKDSLEEIETIVWRVDGKVKEVLRYSGSSKKNLKFDYDAMGQRIAKHIYDNSNTWEKSTYYLRDAQGNVLSVYDHKVDAPTILFAQKEKHLYGSSRIGMDVTEIELISASAPDDTLMQHHVGNKHYELSNHLGNVLAVITDKKIPIEDSLYWITLDGTGDYVGTSSTFNFGLTDEVTLEVWVKTTDSGDPVVMVSNYDPNTQGLHLSLKNGTPVIAGRNGNGVFRQAVGTTAINDGEWHHVVGTAVDDHLKLYVDGILVAQQTPTYSTGDYSGARHFRVGRALHSNAYDIDAELREASMWKRAKTADEIYSGVFKEYTGQESDIVHYWKLNDNTSTTANKVSGAPQGSLNGDADWVGSVENYFEPELISSSDYSPSLCTKIG